LELSARLLGQHAESYAMYRPHKNEVMQYHYEKYRSRYSLGIISKHDVKKMISALKNAKGIWFAPDQNFSGKGAIFSPFMNVLASTNTATSRFAAITDSKVIPFYLTRNQNGYRLSFESPLKDFPSSDKNDTDRINSLFTRWATESPEQYNWIHRRFKTQADGQESPYKSV
jgi:KDO2-lipid IV(A) lauroyltransferase